MGPHPEDSLQKGTFGTLCLPRQVAQCLAQSGWREPSSTSREPPFYPEPQIIPHRTLETSKVITRRRGQVCEGKGAYLR